MFSKCRPTMRKVNNPLKAVTYIGSQVWPSAGESGEADFGLRAVLAHAVCLSVCLSLEGRGFYGALDHEMGSYKDPPFPLTVFLLDTRLGQNDS